MSLPVHLTFLGGLGEIGRNCAALEVDGRIVILDCGQLFPDDLPGVDAVLPDFTWIRERSTSIEGCIITHAHEDHIGALPQLLQEFSFPVYGSAFTVGMIRGKLKSSGVSEPDFIIVQDYDQLAIGPFQCEFLPVTHSTPSGLMTIFDTPQGLIVHSSDFKLDPAPIDNRLTDLARLEELSVDPGIRLLLADSTNADSPGFSASESEVGPAIQQVFEENGEQRIIVGVFSSHIHRIQQIADSADMTGRKLVVLGPSLIRNFSLARELGLLKISDTLLEGEENLKSLQPNEVCVICTGSQGEERAALSLMAQGRHRALTVAASDTIVFSSHPIPGNESAVFRLHNKLSLQGARLVHSRQLGIHTTGHGKADELRSLHDASNPEFFIPVHGEYAHLAAHYRLALDRGMSSDRLLLCTDGDRVLLNDSGLSRTDRVSSEYVMIDSAGVVVSEPLLEERKRLSEEGFVLVKVKIDSKRNCLFESPFVETRGWIEPEERNMWCVEIADEVEKVLSQALNGKKYSEKELTRLIRKTTGHLVGNRTRRRPALVPIVEIC